MNDHLFQEFIKRRDFVNIKLEFSKTFPEIRVDLE